ncbi:hypothetical protein OOZ15_05405 [Galbibacter sp. EGI 63066]|uniref:hypothetical protein n=1 Tax=Galbibacter sp. EGI 63066 TaxID=2993559 RepID=UPI002248DB79|nr:hypothetical protein [Galbibacter sp. EGI 63066]MCX2679373.1 hypothetical protein [Galbibacter sp. EGI 63066]
MKKLKLFLIISSLTCGSLLAQETYYDATAGDGYGFRFWGGNDSYKIHIGNTAEYHYGPVTDYSIKMNMNDVSNRGWTWGVDGVTPIAALNTQGDFQVAGNILASKRIGIGVTDPQTYIDVVNSTASESFLRFRTQDALSDHLLIANTTGEPGQFIPLIKGKHVTDNRTAITFMGEVNPENDTGSTPVVSFNARRYNGMLTERPLFSWANYSTRLMVMHADGRLGVGTMNPRSKLEVKGVITSSSNTTTNYSSFFVSGDGNAYMNFAGGDSSSRIGFQIDGSSAMSIYNNKSVGIGTGNTGPHKLAVEGSIGAREVKIQASGWSDFVFEKDYNLPTLEEVEQHILEKGHLKDIPSAKEVEKNGIYLGEMDAKLLQKIEELTLYTIEQQKMIKEQQELVKQQQELLKQQEENFTEIVAGLKKEIETIKDKE